MVSANGSESCWGICLVCALISACGQADANDDTVPSAGSGGGAGTGQDGGSGSDPTCYGPRQNLDAAVDPQAVGCPCSEYSSDSLGVCALTSAGTWQGLRCVDGRWHNTDDVRCDFPPDIVFCTDDQTCPTGQACVPGGVHGDRVCVELPPESTTCSNPENPENQCCSSADCTTGVCWESLHYPTGVCGGGGFDVVNLCFADECARDTDCAPNEVCVVSDNRPDALKVCSPVFCDTAEDCSAEPGGACSWILGICCGGVGSGFSRPTTLACVYPSDWCTSDSDCAAPNPFCVIDSGRAHCASECRLPT